MIKSKKITVVFQGYIDPDKLGSGATDGTDFCYNLAQTKAALPKAKIVLSTWNSFEFPPEYNTAAKLGVDKIILNPDPGGLPNIKFGYDTANNVNRQITSTSAGMALVNTKYALKMRTDSFLTSANLLRLYDEYLQAVQRGAPQSESETLSTKDKDKSSKPSAKQPKSLTASNKKSANNTQSGKRNKKYAPIAVTSFFTIDPSVYEHMAYHISDWVQFGRRKTLQEYWSVKSMRKKNATYFEDHDQSNVAVFSDNQFRTRLAVEQHIAIKYAKARGYPVPSQYNDIDEDILQGHQRFLAEHFIVLDLEQFGLSFPKYDWVKNDDFMALNCVNHEDWYRLFNDHWRIDSPNQALLDAADQRQTLKRDNADKVAAEQLTMSRIYP